MKKGKKKIILISYGFEFWPFEFVSNFEFLRVYMKSILEFTINMKKDLDSHCELKAAAGAVTLMAIFNDMYQNIDLFMNLGVVVIRCFFHRLYGLLHRQYIARIPGAEF
jgi:hypothetical protein